MFLLSTIASWTLPTRTTRHVTAFDLMRTLDAFLAKAQPGWRMARAEPRRDRVWLHAACVLQATRAHETKQQRDKRRHNGHSDPGDQQESDHSVLLE